jgi:hypothetical protein
VRQPEHQVRWFTQADIASAPRISEDSRILAAELLALTAPPFPWLPGQGRATAAGLQADAAAIRGASPAGHGPALKRRLIVIRGNSASGKSAVAAGIREKYGRGLAIVGLSDRSAPETRFHLRFHVAWMFMTCVGRRVSAMA